MPRVTGLYVFPVKGLRPIELKSATVHELGELKVQIEGGQGRCLIVGRACLFVIASVYMHRLLLGPQLVDHSPRWALSDAAADPQVSSGATIPVPITSTSPALDHHWKPNSDVRSTTGWR